MPSIIGSSYPVSAMVPSVLPAPASAPDTRQAAQKPEGISTAETSRVLSDRVTAFLSSNQASMAKGPRPDGSPAGGAGARTAPRDNTARTENASPAAQLDDAADEPDEDGGPVSGTGSASILIDEAKIYRPSSLY